MKTPVDKTVFAEELLRIAEKTLISAWEDKPATRKQKWKLKSLGVPLKKNLSKAQAFFLLRQKIDGGDLPSEFTDRTPPPPQHQGRDNSRF